MSPHLRNADFHPLIQYPEVQNAWRDFAVQVATLRDEITPFTEASKAGEPKKMTRGEARTLLGQYKDNFEVMKGKAREVGDACDTALCDRAIEIYIESVIAFRADDMAGFDRIVDALTETCKWMDEAAERVDIFRKTDEVFDEWVRLKRQELEGGSQEDVVVINWDWVPIMRVRRANMRGGSRSWR